MERRIVTRCLVALLMVILVAAGGAGADKGGKGGKGKAGDHPGKGAPQGKGARNPAGGKDKGAKKFEDNQRAAIQSYYHDSYERGGDCPPGLAKKNNGCLPPGQAKRRWNVGEPLPSDVVVLPLPGELRMTLAAPLPGYDYGYVDGEVILFATSGRIVVDFVAAF